MSGLSLLDVLLYGGANSSDATVNATGIERVGNVAQGLIDGARNDLLELEKLDSAVAADEQDGLGVQVAAILRGMYDEWARQAEAVLDKVSIVTEMGVVLRGIEELRDAHGRTRAMLSVTLNDIAEARRQVRE